MFKARTVSTGPVNGSGNGSVNGAVRSRGGKPGKSGRLGGLMLAGPVMTVLCVAALPAVAGPRGERVVRGEASFARQGRSTTITAGDRTIIEYDSFNIGRRQSVEFVQPNAGARVLNRISGADPSTIRGTLKSNGIIYIVNPAGVIFGPNSVVDVGGMYAAAATITNQDFVQGNDHFTNVTGQVVNQGSITADSTVNLIGRRVANFGSVVADTGTVTMVAGDEVWIGERGGHVFARFSTDAARERLAGGVENHGTVVADQMLAGVGDYFALALFEPGAVRARIVEVRGGRGTTTEVAGVIDVSDHSAGGTGGSVTITGERVALRGATIDASGDAGGGSVRVGGDYQGRGEIPNSQRTYVAPGTTINADAVTTGDGGRVIVWSDVFTNYNGGITARGGAQGGDGGFAEVSGKQTLAFNGTANLSAVDGAAGRVLLDPRDITIANGGAAAVATNNEFNENAASDVSMDADLITAITNTGTAVTLQANRDIFVNEDITSNNAGGDGGDITLQAGRTVEINADITTDNGDLTIVANETVANGVVNANRPAGAALIDMANNSEIDAGTGNVSLTISTGTGLTNSTSGNIFVEDITTTGTVSITNNGPTAGSSIVIDGAGGNNSLITAGNLAMSVGGAGLGGSIGTGADSIAFTATNVEASSQSGGMFLDATGAVNVGGASGSITGLSTSAAGAIELVSSAGITTSEAIAGNGTVTITGTTVGIGANLAGNDDVLITGATTITGSRTISAGAGQLEFASTVVLSGAGATVTMVGSAAGAADGITFDNTVTADVGGSTIGLEFGDTSTAFGVSTGAAGELVSNGTLGQLQNGFTSIVIGSATGAQNITIGAVTFNDPVTVRTPTSGNINVNAQITGAGNASVTLTPGTGSRILFNFNGTAVSTAGQTITLGGAARVGEGFTTTLDSNGGSIVFGGLVDGTNGGVAEALVLDAGAGTINAQTTPSTLGTGQALDLETVTITDAGIVNLSAVNLVGTLSTTNALTGAFNSTGTVAANAITLNGTSFDFDAAVSTGTGAFTIGSTAATTLNFDSTVTGGSGGIDLTGTGMVFDALVSTTGGGDIALDGAGITLTGGMTTAGANGDIAITNSGLLSIPAAMTATGSITQTDNGGTVSVAAAVTGLGVAFNSAVTVSGTREISATTGALAFNSSLAFSGAGATGTLTGGTIAFGANVTPDAGGTAIVFQSPTTGTAFGVGTGTANQMISSASVAFLQEGFDSITFGRAAASHNIDIAGVTFSDPVSFRTTTAGNITVSGLLTGTDDATVLLDTGAGPARILLDVTGDAIVTAGDLIDLSGLVRVAEGEDPTLNSAGGLIRFGGAVDGTTGGVAETLTLDAGTGNIDFQTVASAVSGASGASDATGLTTLTIADATNLNIQSILISGVLSTSSALGGAVQAVGTVNAGTIDLDADSFDFDAAVTAGAGGIDLSGGNGINFDSTLTAGAGGVTMLGNSMTFDALVSTSAGGDVNLNGSAITLTGGITTVGANANVDITNAGLLSLPATITANGNFTQHDNGGTVNLAATINTSGADGTIQFNTDVVASAPVTLNAGGGIIDLNANFAAGTNNIIFTANDFQPFADDSITGTGTVTLRPENTGDSIALGTAAAATATYTLSDFAALADGFSAIHVGYITTGTHIITMSGFNSSAALRDDMVIHAPTGAGQITLLDDLDVGGETLTFDGAFRAGANLDIDSNTSGSVVFNQTSNFQAFNVSLTGDALPTFTGVISGSGVLTIRPDTDSTAIDIGNVVAAGGVLQGGLVVSQAQLQTLNDTDFAALEFGYATTGTHSIQIGNTTGATAFNSDVTFHAPASGGLINVLADQAVDTSGNANAVGDMTFDGPVTIGSSGVVITAENLLTFEQTLDMNGNDTTLASGDLAFNGGANSVSNTGAAATLSLGPADDGANIDIGNLGGNARVGAWSLDNNDLAALDTSVGTLGFGNAATGSHLIFLGLVTSLNFDAAFNAPAAGGEIRIFDDVTSGAHDLTFNGDVRINNTATPTIDTGGGNVAFNFDVFGSTTGAGETLTVDAGAGDITFAGFIAGQSTGVSNTTALTTVTLTGNNITLASVDISGVLSADNAGTLDITDDIDADGGFTQTNATVSGTSAVTLSGDITTVNTAIEFASNVTQTGNSALTAGTGLIEIGSGLTFDTAGNDLTISSSDIDILGTISGGDGTNTLTLRPNLVTTAIELGAGTSNSVGALVLSNAELSNISNGFGGIEIGFAGTGQHAFEIGTAGFNDPVTLHAPAGTGSFTILAGRTMSGAGDASFTFRGSHATLTLNNGSRITTAGQDINIDDNVLLADGAGNSGLNADIPLISTGAGAGDITIDGSIRGTNNSSGFVERLRIQAGTGVLVVGDVLTVNSTETNIFGALNGFTEEASTEGLVDFSIVSAAGVTLEGVNIAGALRSETALTGGFTANESVLTRSINLSGTTFDFLDGFEATNNGGGTAAFTSSGLVTTTDGEATTSITATGDLTADNLDAGTTIDVDGDLDVTDATAGTSILVGGNVIAQTLDAGTDITITGDLALGDEASAGNNIAVTGSTTLGDRLVADNNITLAGDVVFAINASPTDRGLFAGNTLTTGGGLDTTDQDTTLSGNEINFTGGARSITGGGNLTIVPTNASRDINLGQPSGGNPGATSLDLTDNDLSALDDAFDSITIGVVGGTHDMVFGSSTFRNPMVFNYQAGTARIEGNVFGAGPTASFQFLGADNGGTTLAANITTAGGGIMIDDNVTLAGNAALSNGGSGSGTVEVDGTIDGPFGFTAIGGNGLVEIDGVIGGTTALASLSLSGDDVTLFNGIGTPGAAGVTGLTAITATSILTLGGQTYNTNEAIYRVLGTGNILGTGSGSTATFTTNGADITFDGGGEFDIDDGVTLVINAGGGTINLGAAISGSGSAINFNSAVVLTANTQIDNQGTGPGSTITFGSTVDGGFDLSVTTAGGDITFNGDIGATDALANLNIESAADVLLENVGAGNGLGVEGNSTIVSNGGDIVFNGTSYAFGSATFAASGQHSVASGATTFTTRGGDLLFAGGDIVLANGSDLFVSTDGGDGTFTNIRGDSDEDLTIDLGSGTGFFEGIGNLNEIADIIITCNNIALNQNVFGNTIVLRPGTLSRSIELAGNNTTPQAMRISRLEFSRLREGFTSITLGRPDMTNAIVVGGDSGGPLGFTDPLTLVSAGGSSSTITIQEDLVGTGNASLTITGTTGTVFLASDISTAGQNVSIDGVTLLGGDVSISTAGGDVSFIGTGTIDSVGAARDLTIDAGAGDVSVAGAIGQSEALASTNFSGATITLDSVNTEGDQTYEGDLSLGGNLDSAEGSILVDGDTTLTTDVSVTAGLTAGSDDTDVTFRGTIDGGTNDLTVATGPNADVTLGGAVTNVGTVGVSSGTITVGDVTSTGQQNYTASNALRLNGDLIRTLSGAIAINGDLVLAGDSTISTAGGDTDDTITVDGDVDGAFDLTLNASDADLTITGDVGSSTRLADLLIASAAQTSLQGVRVANFFQTTGSGQTSVAGAVDSNGVNGVVLSAGSFRFDGPVDVGNDLSLTSAEVSRFNGTVDVGGDVSLLGGSFRIGNDVGDTFDVTGSLLVNSTGNLVVSAPLTVGGANGADINVVDMLLSSDLEVTGGAITLTNAGDFILEESGSITLNGRNFRQDGTGDSRLANGIQSNGSNISFDGDIVMTDNLVFRGRSLAFNGRIDSDGPTTPRALVLNSGGPATLAGDVGSVNRIASLTTNANGQTRLAADVFTAGAILIGDDLIVQGDSKLDASDGGATGTIEFMGAIDSDSAASPHSLTVITDVNILDHTLPTIIFHKSIGADAPLDNLFLNYEEGVLNGRDGLSPRDITINGFTIPNVVTPLVPTILVPFIEFDPSAPEGERGFFIRTAGDFRMGEGEKLSVTFDYDTIATGPNAGAFVLDNQGRHLLDGVAIDPATNAPTFGVTTGGDAIFGDLTIDGNLRVTSTGNISFQERAPSVILPKPLPGDDEESYPGDPALLDVDRGTDLVVNGIAAFNKGPSAPGGTFLGTTDLAATIAAGPTGDLIVLQLEPDVFNANDFFMTSAEAGRVLGLSSFFFLDLRSEGSTGSQPPIFGQAPNETQSGTVNQATAIGSIAKRALADLGINARDPDDLLDALIGRALYNDLSGGEGDASYVTANRMSLDIATDLVNEYQAFFRKQVVDENGNPQFDPETGEAMYESRAAEIKARLTAAVQAYRRTSAGQFDPLAFRQFTQSNPDHAQAESDLDTLGHLLQQFQILGLSSGEFAQARLALLRLVRPSQGLNDQQFIAVIDAGDGVMTPAPVEPAATEAAPDEPAPQPEPASQG